MGYVNAGNAVLNGTNIYADYLNTWPPFFSLFSVPLAIGHNLSPLMIRGIWLIGIALTWFGIIRVSNSLFSDRSNVSWTNWLILLPLIFTLRFIIEDISNIQINSMLLLASLAAFSFERSGKVLWAGLLLAFIISLKVYPIFILLYFLYKRAWKMAGWTTLFLVALNGFTLMIFGLETGGLYYETFVQDRILGDPIFIHKNQ